MESKKNYLWLIIALSALLALTGNILVLIYTKCQTTDWLTLISGWVSGFATFFIGIIAYNQSKTYSLINAQNMLLNQITNYNIELQNGYIDYIQADKIIDLETTLLNKGEPLDINSQMISLCRDFLHFEAILTKGICSSENIISLHKHIKEIEDKLEQIHLQENNYLEQWIKKADNLFNSIIMDHLKVRSAILDNNGNLYISECVKEQKIIMEYFSKISEDRINGREA